jgi:biotin carboxyl carrier protein
MATMTRVRVSPAPSSAHPGDAPLVVETDDAPKQRAALVGEVGTTDRDGRRQVEVVVDGWRFVFVVEDADRADLRDRASRDRSDAAAGGGPLEIRAIIPGRVAAVMVAAGDEVEAGRPLLVVEAMKMQNELRAPRDGVVERIAVGPGDTIEIGDTLLVLA